MDGMNAYRRAQYITLISEIHCLPEMAPGNAIASLAMANSFEGPLNVGGEDSHLDESNEMPSSLLSHLLLMCTSIFALSQCMTTHCQRIFSCALIMARCWLPSLVGGGVTVL